MSEPTLLTETEPASEPRPPATRLGNFPVSFFAVVMGLCGFVIATQRMEESLESSDVPSTVLLGITLLVFLVLMGFMAGGYHPASTPLISMSVPLHQRGRALGLHLIGGNSSFFLAPNWPASPMWWTRC